jgi:hypothetical protein
LIILLHTIAKVDVRVQVEEAQLEVVLVDLVEEGQGVVEVVEAGNKLIMNN